MRDKRKLTATLIAMVVICRLSVGSEAEVIRLEVSGGKVDCVNVPVCAVIELPEGLANVPVEEITAVLLERPAGPYPQISSISYPGQLVLVGDKKAELWWILPEAKANKTSTWVATLYDRRQQARAIRWKDFTWKDKKGQYLDLLFDGQKVTRYMYALDRSTKQRVLETYKTFHHVFDAAGENLLTNGPDGENPYQGQITYPHHRGIFVGWNRLEFGGKRYDFWHMGDQGRVQKHEKFLELTGGPVLARSNSLVHWNDKDGRTIIAEQRRTTVFRQSEPTVLLLEFDTELRAVNGDVLLDGDPEHAGFQYRPHNDVAAGGKEVKAAYLFHEDGIDPRRDKDLPWVGMSYGLGGKRYSVLHINHPGNPKETIYSAYRDYGRFGAFFKKQIKAGETLVLRYRIWVLEGQMPRREELASKCSVFVDSPKVEVLGG